MNKPQP